MFTFSINDKISSKDKAQKVAKLIKGINKYNEEVLSDAFINLIQGKECEVSLAKLSYIDGKNKAYDERHSKSDSLINEDEEMKGYQGVVDLVNPFDFETDVIAKADTNYYVETFLDIREYAFFKRGIDLWRLFELVLKRDKKATEKFRWVLDELNLTSFFKEFCSRAEYIEGVKRVLNS